MTLNPQSLVIRQFIINEVLNHPREITRLVCEEFGISRQAVNRHLNELERQGVLATEGSTRNKVWRLLPIFQNQFTVPLTAEIMEDSLWKTELKPSLGSLPKNVYDIAQYGFTEIVNNVIDHSESHDLTIDVTLTHFSLSISIRDYGVGIFRKIRQACGLDDDSQAILELSKGKLTTDPSRHSGEGIFFTSRMCDLFEIQSYDLMFSHIRPDNDWLIETDETQNLIGTQVRLVIILTTEMSPLALYQKFSSDTDEFTFAKTHVPIRLAKYDADNLVSRSQAKRILKRFEKFEEVLLDFDEVEFIGQAFADEIFRVYRNERPDIKIIAANTNPQVSGIIRRVLSNRSTEHQRLLFPEFPPSGSSQSG